MDTPEHHYRSGMYYLDKKDPKTALTAFEKALELDPEYGPAQAGKGLAKAMLGEKDAMDHIEDGLDQARTPAEEIRAMLARMRANIQQARDGKMSDEDLVESCEDTYDDARSIMDKKPELEDPALNLVMGEAYLQALRFDRAEEMFDRVVRLGRGQTDEAKALWELVQKVRRAAPETLIGKRIALVREVTRADMAALLVEELGFSNFMTRTGKPASAAFQPPALGKGLASKEARVVDIASHPLRLDIQMVVEYGFRGLKPFPDNTFKPNATLTRAEVAMILEDVLVKATNDMALATKFIGQDSPFSDLRADHPAFNAAMLCTTRGLLPSSARGGFGPVETVPGVDAVLAMKKMKSDLRVF